MFADGLREVFLQWHRAQVADCSGASASSGKVRLRRGCPRRQGRRIPRVEADSAARAQAPPQRLAYSFLLMMLALLLEATAVRRSSTWQPRPTPFRWHRSEPRFLAQVISRAWFRNFRSIQSIQLEPLAFSEGFGRRSIAQNIVLKMRANSITGRDEKSSLRRGPEPRGGDVILESVTLDTHARENQCADPPAPHLS